MMMINDKDVKMYIRSRHSAFDTPQQIADSLKETMGGKYTVQAVEDIIRSMGYRPHEASERSVEGEAVEAHRRKTAVENLEGIVHIASKKPAANKIKIKDYVPQVIYNDKIRRKIRAMHAENKSIGQIAKNLDRTSRQIEDTEIDMGLRPIYNVKKKT